MLFRPLCYDSRIVKKFLTLASLPFFVIAVVLLFFTGRKEEEVPPRPGTTETVATPLVTRGFVGTTTVLVSRSGQVLYTYDKDTAGQSVCYEDCAKERPPFRSVPGDVIDPSLTGVFGTMRRTDGVIQLTRDGEPLYINTFDPVPGAGEGKGWRMIRI